MCRWEVNIKVDSAGLKVGCSGKCCEHGNEISGSVKDKIFLTRWGTISLSWARNHGVIWCSLHLGDCHWSPGLPRVTEIHRKLYFGLIVVRGEPLIQWGPGVPSLGIRRPGREPDDSLPPSAEFKNAWNCTSTPPIRLHGMVLS